MNNTKKSSKVVQSIVSFLLLLTNSLFSNGFISGTLVKSKNGYIPIERLIEKDKVLSYDYKHKLIVESGIEKISKKQSNKAIRIFIEGHELITTFDHKFFCPLRKGNWIEAKDLQPNDFILKNIQSLARIEKIESFDCNENFYSLSINNNHNYFVSYKDLFVHNDDSNWDPSFLLAATTVSVIFYFFSSGLVLDSNKDSKSKNLGDIFNESSERTKCIICRCIINNNKAQICKRCRENMLKLMKENNNPKK